MNSLRKVAHDLLSDQERLQLKLALKEFREQKDLRKFVEALLPVIQCIERVQLIKKIGQLMMPEMKRNFLCLCDENISFSKADNGVLSLQIEKSRKSAMKRKLTFKSNAIRPFVRFSQDDNLSLSSSQPTIIFDTRVNDMKSISNNILTKTNSLDIEDSQKMREPTLSGLGSSFMDYSIFPNNFAEINIENSPINQYEHASQEFKFFINISENVKVFSHYNSPPFYANKTHNSNKSKSSLSEIRKSKKKTPLIIKHNTMNSETLSVTKNISFIEFDPSSYHFPVIIHTELLYQNNVVQLSHPTTLYNSKYLDLELKSTGTQAPLRISVFCQTD